MSTPIAQFPRIGALVESQTLRRRRGLTVAFALTAIVLTLSACDVTERSVAPTRRTLAAPTSSGALNDSAKARAEAAVAAYRAMWRAYKQAGETANPDAPSLATYSAGEALATLVNGLRSMRSKGLVISGYVVLDPQVTSFTPADLPTTIEITDCADSTNFLLYRSSGEPADDEPGGRRRILASVQDIGGGTWKVTSFRAQDIGTC